MKCHPFTFVSILGCLLACAADQIDSPPIVVNPTDATIASDSSSKPPGNERSRIRLELTPNQSTYAVNSEIQVRVTVNQNGTISTPSDWSMVPESFGVRVGESGIRLTEAGIGLIRYCLEQDCVERSLFVVDKPTLRVHFPARGEMIELNGSNSIVVSGQIENLEQGFPTVLVNGEPAEISDDFQFSAVVPVDVGLNALDIQVREPTLQEPPALFQQFIAAHNYQPNGQDRLRIADALTIDLHERLLDSDLPRVVINPGQTVQLLDVVQFIDVITQTTDPLMWLPDPLTDLEGLTLEVDAISMGLFAGDIRLPGEVAEADFSLTNATVQTKGNVSWMGTNLSLDGSLNASLSAFIVFDGQIDETLEIDLQEIEAELLSVEAEYPSNTLNDLVEALDSELTEQIIGVLTNFIKTLFREQALPLVQFSFAAMLEQIQVLPIEIPAPIAGAPDVSLTAEVVPSGLDLIRGKGVLKVDVDIESSASNVFHENDKGVLLTPITEPSGEPELPLTLRVKLDLLNALCHAVWKTGIINISPTLPSSVSGLVENITINAKLPPVISLTSSGTELFELRLGELQVEILPKGSSLPDLYVLHMNVPATLSAEDGFVSLEIESTPTIQSDTLVKASESPVNARVVEGLLLSIVWPQIEASLGEDLTYGIGDIPVEGDILRDIAPYLARLTLVPTVDGRFIPGEGVITVGGRLIAEATRRAEPPTNAE